MSRLKEMNNKVNDVAGVASGGGTIVNEARSLWDWITGKDKKRADEADARQLAQQDKLTQQQVQANKALANHEQALKMQMWKDTNYGAQLNEAQKAGVSKAAVLGGSAGGGATAQGASVGDAIGGKASGGAELQMARQQEALMKAQVSNMNADTALKQSQAKKTGGVDTEQVKANIEGILTGIKNTRVKTAGEELNNILKDIQIEVEGATKGDKISLSSYEVEKASYQTAMLLNEKGISDATKQERIDALVNQNAQTLANINKTDAETANIEERTKAIATELKALMMNAWSKRMDADTNRTAVETDWKRGLGNIVNQLTGFTEPTVGLGDVVKGTIKTITPRWTWKYIDKYMNWYERGGK